MAKPALEDEIVLSPGTHVHAVDDDSGFLEESAGVRRIQGERLGAAVSEVLGALTVPRRVGDVLDGVRDLSRDQALTWLSDLLEAGLVRPGRPVAGTTVQLCGDETLTACARVALPAHARVSADGADLLLVIADSLYDARAEALARDCVRRGSAFLVAGADPGRGAFVTPVWRPGERLACYECVRTRLHANAPTGRTRWEYQQSLSRGGVSSGRGPVGVAGALGVAAVLAGVRAAAWLNDADGPQDDLIWIGDDLSAGHRPVLPVPTCSWCDQQQTGRERVEPGGLLAAVDDVAGIVHSATVRLAESGPRVHLGGSVAADNSLVRPSLRVTLNGGAGFTRSAALLSTAGESVERYAAGIWRREDLVVARYDDLDGPAVHPGEFALYSPEQYADPAFPYRPFTASDVVRWTRAHRLRDGAEVWVPASTVYLPYRRVREEDEFAPSISTGLAAGPGHIAAVLSGLQEVIERDALAISWLHRLPPRPVSPEVVAASPRVAEQLALGTSWTVDFHDLSLDLDLPVVAAVMRYRRDREDVLSFGSACRGDLTGAVEKAFLEAAQGLTYVRRLLRTFADWEAAPDFSDVDEFNKHAILYTRYPHLRERAGYLLHGPITRRPARLSVPAPEGDEALLDSAVRQLAGAGHEVYVVDLTTPDVAALGVRVVRVLVPGLQHLSGSHALRFLGGRRLNEMPLRLARSEGHESWSSRPDNSFPHPLP
ncbi:TOMM precursor leader peptide-binding protein [Kineosporia mesophila]|uniref:TOMM leader peptide-binding protein n=1 Tax=Kineosporia mesophila TaxID=566012 RepID=A0ABP7AVL2_9ACTN|nr:TOMM precursor leader peptide-binding protein [Kineosporia mesophila]MCD5352330.1 TOMM precursor leader peptide-binding protein [Kineosporia mesophila]